MADQSNRRYLVLARVGDRSLHKGWIADASVNRTWDLQLNAYGNDESRVQDGDLPTVIDRGTKFDSIVRQLRANPALLDRYDYIMLPDDDLIMEARDINRFFEIVTEHDLTMAQPALSLESYISYPILLRNPFFKLRYVNFLEAMACCFKSSYLKSLLPLLEKHYSSWGVDLIWTMLMRDPPFRSAVIDVVPMTHTRPLYSGPIYDAFAKAELDPHKEIKTLTGSFDNYPGEMLVYGGVLKNDHAISGPIARIINGLHLLRIANKSKLRDATLKAGFGMLLRALTRIGYRPEQLRPLPTAIVGFIQQDQISGVESIPISSGDASALSA